MGISTVAYVADNRQLHQFEKDPDALRHWFEDAAVKYSGFSLHDYWRSVHGLLSGLSPGSGLPWTSLTEGDLRFPGAADGGAHGLWADTTAGLAAVACSVSMDQINEYARAEWAAFAARTGRDPVLTDAQLAAPASDLRIGLAQLRKAAEKAKGIAAGLVIARWEDL
jgi:hypothetical protein